MVGLTEIVGAKDGESLLVGTFDFVVVDVSERLNGTILFPVVFWLGNRAADVRFDSRLRVEMRGAIPSACSVELFPLQNPFPTLAQTIELP